MEKLIIVQDQNPFNPREDDCKLGVIAYKHSKYNLGEEYIDDPIDWFEDKMGINRLGRYNSERLEELEELFFRNHVGLKVYLYDHSGITISTTPFSCKFDSGQVGYIYTTKERIRNFLNVKRITQKTRKRVEELLAMEIEEFNDYLTGNIYGYEIVDENGNLIDSCGGFFGTEWENNGLSDYLPEHIKPQLKDIEVTY